MRSPPLRQPEVRSPGAPVSRNGAGQQRRPRREGPLSVRCNRAGARSLQTWPRIHTGKHLPIRQVRAPFLPRVPQCRVARMEGAQEGGDMIRISASDLESYRFWKDSDLPQSDLIERLTHKAESTRQMEAGRAWRPTFDPMVTCRSLIATTSVSGARHPDQMCITWTDDHICAKHA